MSTNNSLHKNRWKSAAQWIQAVTTLGILVILYSSRNLFGGEVATGQTPDTPPLQNFPQKSYWNEDFGYGFRGEDTDKYQNHSLSNADFVAVDSKEGVIFEDARVKVSFYPSLSIEEIDQKYLASTTPRAYTRLSRGIAVVEGDLDSPSAKTIIATLHTR